MAKTATRSKAAAPQQVAHVDVLIIGAGLSGIGAAAHLVSELPDKTFALLERRDAIGGTWDLFKYPGIRSDSDMNTLGYRFRPWRSDNVLADGPVRGRVVFDDVTFAYDPARPLIQHLDLVAEPGQTVAIVGPTGAGKTTLVNLIMRFYELDGGSITLDGVDISTIPRAQPRSQIGMVLQDTWLFGGTIRDNIAYGRPDATDEEILAAAKACYVDRFVHSLPDGYDTLINEEGDNISAGQKQLITIARAFLADRSILILDEATSSVDTRTEVQVQVAMNRLRKDRTSFVIAHRLSTIRGADTILVMQNGTIVEQGSHEELLSHDGPYFRLYNSQFAGAVAESDPNALQS